ncbi:hypothetical protein D3C80_1555880 [compost metagenome]
MHYGEGRFKTVRQIGERGAVFVVAIAFAFEQAIEVPHQACQFAGGFRIEFFTIMFFKLAHLFSQRFDRAQTPPGGDP